MASQLGIDEIVTYMLGRAQANSANNGWTDAAGQGWKISIVTASGSDSQMTTTLRLRFDPVILASLLPDGSRQSQQFDIGIAARDTATGNWRPNW